MTQLPRSATEDTPEVVIAYLAIAVVAVGVALIAWAWLT